MMMNRYASRELQAVLKVRKGPMKASDVFLYGLFGGSLVFGQNTRSFTGEIMDRQCAGMGTHSQTMKKEGAKDAKECTLACVKMGGKFVLYNPSTKTTYQLDDQDKPRAFAGQPVTVKGTFDSASKTIHVQSIEPAS
jgi:hypothetical protein